MAAVDVEALQAQLDQWAAVHYHEGVMVRALRPMPGHAGLSFGFDVADNTGVLDRLVMRMPPKGVRRAGNTDVLRQVPLLRALATQGVPVAPVVWFDDDEQWFGVPFFMVRFLPGETFVVREPAAVFADVDTAQLFRAAVEALAQVHRVDYADALAGWQEPRLLRDEIEFWTPILAKAAEPEWVAMGERARDLLLANVPQHPRVGVFHGDFQTGNILFDGTSVVAIVDWEISGIGAQLLDIGWLLFMNDPDSWADRSGVDGVPPFEQIVAWYADALGEPLSLADVAFYRALSGYRFGVISGLNVMLHRTGKRPDPEWERIALSVPAMFNQACALLQ